jgi:hypothetical protein
MYRKDHLWCLIDNGPIESIGRFRTKRGETIEVGLCNFDAALSGFRWNEERGWEPIFLKPYDSGEGLLSICTWTEDNTYTKAEIAAELESFRAIRQPPQPPAATQEAGDLLDQVMSFIRTHQDSDFAKRVIAYAYAGYKEKGPGVICLVGSEIPGEPHFVYMAKPLDYDPEREIVFYYWGEYEKEGETVLMSKGEKITLDRPASEIAAEFAAQQQPS